MNRPHLMSNGRSPSLSVPAHAAEDRLPWPAAIIVVMAASALCWTGLAYAASWLGLV
jgi:hypothetical protein